MGEQTNTAALLQARAEMTEAIAAGKITPQIVAGAMTKAFGGTDASGAWGWRTAYDVMQSAALEVAQGKFKVGQMEWLPPSPDGIVVCQGGDTYSHKAERTATYGYDDRCGLGKVCFSGARCVNGG